MSTPHTHTRKGSEKDQNKEIKMLDLYTVRNMDFAECSLEVLENLELNISVVMDTVRHDAKVWNEWYNLMLEVIEHMN